MQVLGNTQHLIDTPGLVVMAFDIPYSFPILVSTMGKQSTTWLVQPYPPLWADTRGPVYRYQLRVWINMDKYEELCGILLIHEFLNKYPIFL